MQGWLVRIGGRLCYLLAGLVIMLAIVVILSRLFVPLMDQHRPEIERWATTLLQTPVKIGKARFSWYRYQPELTFDRVTVIDKKTQQPKLQIERLSIFFSIFECLWQKKLIPSAIRATGSNINIIRSSKGAYALQGFQDMGRFDDKPYQTETSVMDSLAWLSSQPKILLEDINVKYKRAGSKHEHLMTLKTFSFENQSAKHVV